TEMLTRHPSSINLNTDKKDEKNVSIITNTIDTDFDTHNNIISTEKATEQVETVSKFEGKDFDKTMSTGTDYVLNDRTKEFDSNLSATNKTKDNRSSKEYSLGSGTSSSSMDDKEEKLSKEEVKDTSSFVLVGEINDSESLPGSGGSNEPDSPPLLNASIPNVIEIERRKGSLRRKKSSRSIFSVLSVSLSNKDTSKGSLSESEGDPLKTTSPKSPSKSDRILGRSGFSSLSIRNRRSKSIISLDDKLHISEYSNLGSSDIPEKTSKVGKLLGLTPMEERILLDKPLNGKISKKMRSSPSSSIDEKHNDKNRNHNQIIGG
ncbi:5671_t:CDS:2, partial [Cetraspora pellucida]